MNLKDIFTFSLIGVSVLLVIVILLQQKEGGLSTVFGGEGTVYRQKRGLAKGLHYFTVVLAVLFIALSIMVLFMQ
ncbi:MAG: preprotein translocase subunit SecG [Candidatus Doudnabacteria bacterium RIFCSPLOWO2_02_FULL_48_8]|uniref:Protein-export membrane protein SecG n=1 Tax=Candidatus Doudnabacteria bacterium RIFCSPHIGHO2_01_FULL_46_24 TaxID=1817825 RepID=A0A1F5NTS2_9BACT|nr:MAG: preprotein translocase subunit SecG [Candidatus Doudnabacteria bacterium RIFCSPHIGHO2_01_FULL_46_24]OGE94144.1 MAG: preprotein translocase subunit SecG [Candidatus Doudnabacteria bacterium RIFCSPHIGHO2_12_FULL_48_11]OGE95586.1 MAG: preprotein translocase subunit SecG [Candidatus Doudnabacteria bacterium RIFCSPLOWO2_02_FULL_48_8]